MARIGTVIEYIVAVGIRTREYIAAVHKVNGNTILINEGVNMTRTSINILHHFSGR